MAHHPQRIVLALAAFSLLTFAGAGCISFSSNGLLGQSDGGIYKSADKADSFTQVTAIPSVSGQKLTFSATSIASLVQDPEDHNALYAGTTENGLLYTYDGAATWQQAPQITAGRIASVAVDSKNKCAIYIAVDNRLLKSVDCSRTWTEKFRDPRADKTVNAVVADFYNSQIVWIGNSAGEVLRSTDGGESWTSIQSFGSAVVKIVLNAADSRKIYVGTKNDGVWRSVDGGTTWRDLSLGYNQFQDGKTFYDMAVGGAQPNTIIIATGFGLLRSQNGGDSWEKMDLLTPPNSTVIYSVAIDPKDAGTIYYGTASTLYRTINAGVNWVTKKLPTTRAATQLMVDSSNSNVLYMGVTKFKK